MFKKKQQQQLSRAEQTEQLTKRRVKIKMVEKMKNGSGRLVVTLADNCMTPQIRSQNNANN